MKAAAPHESLKRTGSDHAWRCTAAATILIALVIGSRSSFGLFLSPMNTATGFGLAAIGFAAALGQLGQGLAQPLIGMLAERHGAARVITVGALAFVAATASLTAVPNAAALAVLVVLTGVAGTAMGGIAMLLGEVGRRVPPARQGLAIGIVGAGGSVGQLLFGPLTQAVIQGAGWVTAMWMTAGFGLLALPLALVFRRPAPVSPAADGEDGVPAAASATAAGAAGAGGAAGSPGAADAAGDAGAAGAAAEAAATDAAASAEASGDSVVPGNPSALRTAFGEPMFWQIGGGFAVCGFHMSFLTMHMPGFIERCGLPESLSGIWLAVLGLTNVAGSLVIGLLLKRHSPASLLMVLHALRAVFIACLLAAPASPAVMLVFAAAMGATYMAALPPTTVMVTQAFGPRRVATLFGVVMLLHQAGSFCGAWLGGLAAGLADGYRTLWLLDIGLALLAVAIYLPGHRRNGRSRASLLATPAA